MGKEKHKKPEQLKVKANDQTIYDKLDEAKALAQKYSPNKNVK